MAAKRNNTKANDAEAQAAAAAAEAEKANAEAENAEAQNAEPTDEPVEDTREAVNADEMAAAVKVAGNSYQQYIRQLFKQRLEESR